MARNRLRPLVLKAAPFGLLLLSLTGAAQPGHWRVGLQLGTASTRSEFTATPAIPANRLTVTTPIGTWSQAYVERSITPHLSLKAGIGRMRLPYSTSTYSELRDATGQVLLTSGGSSGGGDAFTYAALGVTANTPAWGPFILTSGLDLHLRYNRYAKSTFVYGGFGTTTSIRGQDTLRTNESYLFTPQPTPTFTLAAALHAGLDVRLSQRAFLSVVATYNVGLGPIRQATSAIVLDNQRYDGRFAHRGSFLGYRAGVKYAIGKRNPLGRLQYTAYNRPQPRAAWYAEEQARTFTRGSWLAGVRVGYFSERASNGFEVSGQARGAYFILNRLAVGVRGKYIRDYRFDRFPITRSWLAGPLIRYQISAARVAPFVEGAYQIGRVQFDARSAFLPFAGINETVRVASLTAGLSVRLSPNLRLDAAAETEQFSYYPSLRKSPIRPQLGLTYLIKKKTPLGVE